MGLHELLYSDREIDMGNNRKGTKNVQKQRYVKDTDRVVHRVCMPGGKNKGWRDADGTKIADTDTELR